MPKPLLLALAALLAAAGCTQAPEPPPILAVAAIPTSQDAEIAAFYAERGGRPLWINRGERRLLRVLSEAWSDGFDPARYRVAEIVTALQAGDPQALARADLLLSEAWVRYRQDLAAPAAAARPLYAEEGLAPVPQTAKSILEAASAAPEIATHADHGRRLNAVYDGLRDGFRDYRRRWSSLPQIRLEAAPSADTLRRRLGLSGSAPVEAALRRFQRVHGLPQTGQADRATVAALNLGSAHYERIIRANLERARAVPPQRGRFVLVDTAAARVWMFEGTRAAGTMRAIVGKRGMETPALAGRLRYAVLNPYWNVPVDLARQRAQRVLREGTGVLARERLQILSQFHAEDRVLSPASVNWGRVAAGREPLRLRQLPGGANVMGAVKFMMPNNLDIYLHDFPDKSLFALADRRISSGCVRLEDAQAFARWLFGGTAPQPSGSAPEQRVDLPAPVPVYIGYFTAVPDNGSVAFQADPEGRDAALIAALAGQRQG
ncbi:MAG TPA: L,D-transpeptidase family protein [Allosphingosinicella sp.]